MHQHTETFAVQDMHVTWLIKDKRKQYALSVLKSIVLVPLAAWHRTLPRSRIPKETSQCAVFGNHEFKISFNDTFNGKRWMHRQCSRLFKRKFRWKNRTLCPKPLQFFQRQVIKNRHRNIRMKRHPRFSREKKRPPIMYTDCIRFKARKSLDKLPPQCHITVQ